MKTIRDCEVPNPADDIIFCTRTWHSDSSSSTSGRRELGLGLQSDCDSEAVSSHDKKRATVSIAEDLELFRHLFTPSLSRFLVELSNDTDAPEVVLCNAISYQLF